MLIIRAVFCLLIAIHGWARLLSGAVEPFGLWLDDQGLLWGTAIAWSITVLEIVGSVLLFAGAVVGPLCASYALIYFSGLLLVHAEHGWFVVGLGRNGMEYSVLLLTCLLAIYLDHLRHSRR